MSDRQVQWTISDIVVASVLFLIAITGGSFIISVLLAQVAPRVGSIFVFVIGYVVLFFLIWYLAITKRGADWPALGFRPFDLLRGLGLVIIWFFLVRIIIFLYVLFIERIGVKPPDDITRRLPEIFGTDILGILLAVIVVAVVAPFIEELFFRGFIYPVFRQRWGVTIAIIANGLLFALFHFNLLVFVPIAVIGFALAYLFEQTNSLGPPTMLHALNNFISVFLVYYSRVFAL
ncbi:MAG: CPBP family intramembrane metalloprotease [Actinobacteria bacterium]|nr:CPBP family intramembrane metalloprotease [Actinomycetota bacterium]